MLPAFLFMPEMSASPGNPLPPDFRLRPSVSRFPPAVLDFIAPGCRRIL